MYKFSNGQISLADFKQPIGMNLKEDNRWVKRAVMIPWNEIEERYAALFKNRKGNVAKSLRLALGACIIQADYGYSDEEVALQIQENAYLQYFCGYTGYDDSKPPFDPSLMVYFRKRLTPEILGEINEIIVSKGQAEEEKRKEEEVKKSKKSTKSKKDDNDDRHNDDDGGNSGTMIVDATCAPSNIRYPQDISLLDEAREDAEKIIDSLCEQSGEKKPRTYRKRAHKEFNKHIKCRKHTAQMTRKAIRKQLGYLNRDIGIIDRMLEKGGKLKRKESILLETIKKISEQQTYMIEHHTHRVDDRIVSVNQPYVRPIVRGKPGKPVEFGAKLDMSVSNGWTRLEYCSFDPYNESTKLVEMVERFNAREGHYPKKILADKIYRTRENLGYCKLHGIRLSGPSLGRPKKDEQQDRKQNYRDECDRVEIERKFSLAKRKCGLGLVRAKLQDTAMHVIAMSILVLNLRKIQCVIFEIFVWLLMRRRVCENG